VEEGKKISKNKTANRILFNTILVYAQKFSTAALALVTTPLLLRVLGVEDYGVYTLTLGFVGMLTFFTWSLSASTQRYIAVTLGEKNFDKLSHVLSSSLLIHLVYGLLIMVVIQVINFYYVNDFLEIPVNRKDSIHYILTFVAGISFFNIIAIPFIGSLRATEDFKTIALVGVSESLLKLVMAFMLLLLQGDKLILFSGLMFLVSILSFLAYFYRVMKVKNSLYTKFNKPEMVLIKEMLSFISWSILGAIAVMSRNQGVTVLLNVFFGVIANAAYGISQQINNALNILAQGVTASMSPVLMKAAGEQNYEKMFYMMRTMAKLSFFSISIFSIPAFFQMDYLLELWLKVVPEGSAMYGRLIIILVLVVLLSSGMQNVFVAIGKVKTYNIYVSLFLILNLPISYILFKFGFASYTIIIVGIVLELITLNIRLILLNKYLDYKISTYFKEIAQITLPTIIVSAILFFAMYINIPSFLNLILSFMLSIIISPILIYKFSLDSFQKQYVTNMISKFKLKR
jgi:O-antigen/teichoic acid export membrane protein